MVFTKHVYVTCYTNSWYWIITSSLESSYVPYFQCKLMEYISDNSNVQLFCHECDTDNDDVWSQSMTKSKNFFENLEIMEMKYTIYKHRFGRVHFTSIISRFLKRFLFRTKCIWSRPHTYPTLVKFRCRIGYCGCIHQCWSHHIQPHVYWMHNGDVVIIQRTMDTWTLYMQTYTTV